MPRKKKEAAEAEVGAIALIPVVAPKPKRKRKAKIVKVEAEPGVVEIMAQPADDGDAMVDDFDDDFEPLDGCDCDQCNEARARRGLVEPAPEPEPVPVVVEGAKPKRNPRARIGKKAVPKRSPDVPITSIRLLPPAPATLRKAIAILKDPANIEKVRAASNISHIAMVGKFHTDIQFDRVCHACCSSMVSQGNNFYNKGQKYKERYNADIKPYGAYEYWNDKKNVWQQAYVELSKRPEGSKRRFFNYRYMVTWTNERLKPEYHAPGKEFTKHQKAALKAWYLWLAKDSQWARFFVGPKDAKTLVECGCILDMSAPSFIVHLMAVSWRISGEYVEVVEEWFNLCNLKCDPHVAFGMAQNLKGWGDMDGVIEPCYSSGHNLMSNPTINGLARLATGRLHVEEWFNMQPAYSSYSTSCNYVYKGDGYDDGWFSKLPKELFSTMERENNSRWGGKAKVTVSVVRSDAWQHQWSAGWLWLNAQIAEVIQKKGWSKPCSEPSPT